MEIVIFAENFETDCIFIVIMIDSGGSVCSCGYSFATCDARYAKFVFNPTFGQQLTTRNKLRYMGEKQDRIDERKIEEQREKWRENVTWREIIVHFYTTIVHLMNTHASRIPFDFKPLRLAI